MSTHLRVALLLAVGLANLVGVAIGQPRLSGVALATAASPAPKVFTTHSGLETFSNTFVVRWTEVDGSTHEKTITPADYAQIRGPYNRRNVFGAVLAYGPVLSTNASTEVMFHEVSTYALCGDAPLLRELGLSPTRVTALEVEVQPRPGATPELPLVLEAPCTSS